MPDVICNTSPLQYLYQLDLLSIIPALTGSILVPPAVVEELAVGRAAGVRVPDPETLPWIKVRRPVGELVPAVAPLLDQLYALRFRVSPSTRAAILHLAGE